MAEITPEQRIRTLTREELVVTVCPRVSGVGNGSCGPGVLPAYQIVAEPLRYRVRLKWER